MKIINLLPKSEQKETKLQFLAHSQLLFWFWVVISLAIFLIVTLLARVYLMNQQSQAAEEISVKQEELASSDNEQLKQQVDSLNLHFNAIRNLQNQHIYWSKGLAELADLLPGDVEMDLIKVDRATNKIEIKGVAGSRDSVLQFWSDVHKSEYLTDIDFPLANLERATDDTFTFSLSANIEKLKAE